MLNSDQWTTTLNHAATAILAALTLLGIVDAATASQLVTVLGEAMTALLAFVTAAGTIVSIATAVWRRSHPQQIAAAVRTINETKSASLAQPIADAIIDAGGSANTATMAKA